MDRNTLLGYEIHEPMRKIKEYSFGEVALIAFLTLFITGIIIEICL